MVSVNVDVQEMWLGTVKGWVWTSAVDAECSGVLWFQLEEAFQKQQQDEIAARQAEKERVERERIEARKRLEVQRITEVWSLFFSLQQ
jgi:hypothetical protein